MASSADTYSKVLELPCRREGDSGGAAQGGGCAGRSGQGGAHAPGRRPCRRTCQARRLSGAVGALAAAAAGLCPRSSRCMRMPHWAHQFLTKYAHSKHHAHTESLSMQMPGSVLWTRVRGVWGCMVQAVHQRRAALRPPPAASTPAESSRERRVLRRWCSQAAKLVWQLPLQHQVQPLTHLVAHSSMCKCVSSETILYCA